MTSKITKYELLPAQYKFLFKIPENKLNDKNRIYNDISLYQGGVTCKKASAEYLSPTGWKTIDKLTKKDKLAVYYPDGHIEFEHPKEVFVWDADEWYELDTRSIHQINCPNHRMYTIKDGREHIQSMKDFYDEHNSSKNGHRGKFITTFTTHGKKLNPIDLKLEVAFQADGYISSSRKYPHMFHFKKERKVSRLVELLKEAKLDYFCRKETDGYYRIGTKLNIAFKIFPNEWYCLDSDSLKIITNEAPLWDGTVAETNYSYYSSVKENADFIQFAASASGYKATLYTRTRKMEILNQGRITETTEYRVKYQNNNIAPSMYSTRNKNEIKVYKAEKGEKKYCPSTSTKLWLCREFGRITVTGNSGKTFSGSLRGLIFALQWAGCKGLVGAKSQDLLDSTTKEKYVWHLTNMGMKEGVHWWYENRKTIIRLINGSSIMFKTLSDWEQFMSTEFTWIEFEEASFLDEIVFLKLITRLREGKRDEWKNYYRALFMHTNPQGLRGWLNKHFINPKTRHDSYRYIQASTRENTFLGSEYTEMLEELYSEEQLREMVEGLDTDNDNTIAFPQFRPDNVVEHIPINRDKPLILACDFNYNPMCWYLMQEDKGVWYILTELIKQNVTTTEMCQAIQQVVDDTKIRRLIIMGDAHGRDKKTNGSDYGVMINYFYKLGYEVNLRVQKSNPLIRERLALMRGLIRNAKDVKRVYVDSSCQRLLYNFENCKNNLGNGGIHIPTDSEIQADPDKLFLVHPIDAVSYPMFYLNRLRQTAGEDIEL